MGRSSRSCRRSSASALRFLRPARRGRPDRRLGERQAGLRNFCLSIAVAEGETMGDVVFGYVHDFGTARRTAAGRRTASTAAARRGPSERHGGDPRDGRSPRRSPTTPRRLSATRSGSGSWARSPRHCASSPPAGWTRSALPRGAIGRHGRRAAPDPRGRPVDRVRGWDQDGAPLDTRPHGVLVAARTDELRDRLGEILVM